MTTEPALRQMQRGVAGAMLGAFCTAILVLGVAAWADGRAAPLAFGARLQCALRADLLVIGWLAAAIANVARLRFFSARDIAGSSSGANADAGSDAVRVAGAILQNTAEQVVLAIVTHLIVAATFDRANIAIVALARLFAIGRLLFWIGYRHGATGRAFGFALTFYPSVLALIAACVAVMFG